MTQYRDDEIDVIKNDIERLRVKPSMYISYTKKKGVVHLLKEATNNAIDERLNPLSPCDSIFMEIDENTNIFTIIDNGRGIPLDNVEDLCTYLQSGANLHKDQGDAKKKVRKAGDHGVGLTAINAFSKHLTVISYQLTIMKKGTFRFEDGKLVERKIEPYKDKKKHGTTVSFCVDDRYLGTNVIDTKMYREWLEDISYLLPEKTKFELSVIKKGKKVGVTEKFTQKNGISDKLDLMVKDPAIKTVRISKEFNDGDFIDIAVTYSADDISDFTNYESYCNWVHTIDDGEHVKAFKYGWCQAVSKIVNSSLTESEKKKNFQVSFEDCRQGLCAVINLVCLFPLFTGQTKQQVGNDELFKPLSRLITKEVTEYFKKNQADCKKLISTVKGNAKARLEMKKHKHLEVKSITSLDTVDLKGFYACESKFAPECEIFITEGDSAGGQVVARRNPRYQAVFTSKGNPLNAYGLTIPKILENDEMRKFYYVGEAGIGPSFNPKKFRFGKVILFVDSDIDAFNMMSLWSAAFLWCSPALVQEGRVYRTKAPLYLLNDKTHPYVLSKHEFSELFADRISQNVELVDMTGHKLTKKELRNLIVRNSEYYREIQSLEKYFFVDGEIIEAIIVNEGKNMLRDFKKRFPETSYDEKLSILSTIFKNSRYSIRIRDNFYRKTSHLKEMINENNHRNIYYKVIDHGTPLVGEFSLGSVFKLSQKYIPDVVNRIKGVGELPDNVIWDTVLNPKTRQLIQLTCDDLEKELEIVRILHGKDPSLRKDFMKGYRINKDDLDT